MSIKRNDDLRSDEFSRWMHRFGGGERKTDRLMHASECMQHLEWLLAKRRGPASVDPVAVGVVAVNPNA